MTVNELRSAFLADLSWKRAMFETGSMKSPLLIHEFVDVMVANSLRAEPSDEYEFEREVLREAFVETGLRLDPKHGGIRYDAFLEDAFDSWTKYAKINNIDLEGE